MLRLARPALRVSRCPRGAVHAGGLPVARRSPSRGRDSSWRGQLARPMACTMRRAIAGRTGVQSRRWRAEARGLAPVTFQMAGFTKKVLWTRGRRSTVPASVALRIIGRGCAA